MTSNQISISILGIVIIIFSIWLVKKNLKEGNKAIEEIKQKNNIKK